jgi:HEAT repeat protein
MKRITLPIALALAVSAVSAVSAAAQTPPTPPAPAPRVTTPTPAIAPTAPRGFYLNGDDAAREANRIAREVSREMAEQSRIDAQLARENARAAAEAARPFAVTETFTAMPSMPAMAPMAPMAIGFGERDHVSARAAWARGDAADSLYRIARDLFNRGDWGRAARIFADIQKNYPTSAYRNDSQYYEAYARYKIGTTDELRAAARILEPLASKVQTTASTQQGEGFRYAVAGQRRAGDNEILALYMRINGALAQRGDADAAAKVAKAAQQGAACDAEDIQVRTEALSALAQMDPAGAVGNLRRVLEKKDDCSAQLRRNAVMILGRRADADAAQLLLATAKGDPNTSVRVDAMTYLSRLPGDAGVAALEEMLRSEQDERVQAAAVRALMATDNAKARSSMRALIDRKDAPLRLRVEAINSYNSERASNDDAAYLRGLYGKVDDDQLKNAIVNAVSRIGGSENDQWVIGIARNANEPSSVRSNALSRLSRSPTVTTADLVKLYDASAESYDVRNRIISLLGNRKDQEATDKLVDIVKTSTVINHRMQAINALRNKNDPRATQLLMDILDGKKP